MDRGRNLLLFRSMRHPAESCQKNAKMVRNVLAIDVTSKPLRQSAFLRFPLNRRLRGLSRRRRFLEQVLEIGAGLERGEGRALQVRFIGRIVKEATGMSFLEPLDGLVRM